MSENRGGFLLLAATVLLQALADTLTLCLGEIVDEQFAVQVIHLVLHADGKQAVELALDLLSVPIEVANPDMLGAAPLPRSNRAPTGSPPR